MTNLLRKSNFHFRLAFKEDNQDKIFYVKNSWRIDALQNLSFPDDKVICELEVTDCKEFWTRSVTIVDLKRSKPENIHDISKYCGATYAALSGLEEYENHKLTCRITNTENHVRILWRWSMENAAATALTLKFTLGSLLLTPVSYFETHKMWREWMDFFIMERQRLTIASTALETRVSDLENVRDRMQERIELMIAEKINHESILMDKFKKVLNTKKKKIKNLMSALNATGAIISSQAEQSKVLSEEVPMEECDESHDELMIDSSTNRKSKNTSRGRPPNSKLASDSSVRTLKKLKLDDNNITKSKKDTETSNKQQGAESVLTKTFRGQIMKSRRMGRKKANTTVNNDALNSLNEILVGANDTNINTFEDNSQENSDQDNTADNLLDEL
ncbi:12256_t:CDS:2 [Acaulospora morrowiae]|uniref:12256_t:CDS:1 n=1 Tax=Acaulospora morrowiae TaxID=94023 RepID=A0A9N9EXW8_9GLOM|nr:12256_t:CDS:2 [Acaulospora morrowiae]